MSSATLRILPCALLLVPSLALGQSLGEAAKRETERRKKLQQSGRKTTTVTDEDLKNNKGQVANDPWARPAAQTGTAPDGGSASGAATSADDSARGDEQTWKSAARDADLRIAQSQRTYEALKGMSLVPGEYYVDGRGRVVFSSPEQIQEQTAAAKRELDQAIKDRDDLHDRARRQGVPPGWLRY